MAVALAAASPALGATFAVNSTVDQADANPGDGLCAIALGPCTLRAAIQEANAFPGVDEVSVPAGTYVLSLAGQDEEAAATGDLDVTEALTITGAGASSTVVDAGGIDRVFETWDSAEISGLTLTGGDLAAGIGGAIRGWVGLSATACDFAQNRARSGGAVASIFGAVALDQCAFDSNTAEVGGAVWSLNGSVSVSQCVFRSNTAGSGGAVRSDFELTVTDSLFEDNVGTLGGGAIGGGGDFTIGDTTFSRNEAPAGGGGAVHVGFGSVAITGSRFDQNRADDPTGTAGGGAILFQRDGRLTVEASTLTDNHALGNGGAISVVPVNGGARLTLRDVTISACTAQGSGGAAAIGTNPGSTPSTVRVVDSTLSGNDAGVSGGAVFVGGGETGTASLAVLVNSTLSGNSASRGGAVSLEDEASDASGGRLLALSSTIAFNDAAVGGGIDAPGTALAEMGRSILFGSTGGSDCEGTIASLGHNVFGTVAPCTLAGVTPADLLGVDPLLGPLQDNGGPTFTHELRGGSPAIEAAVDACVDDAGVPLSTDQRGMPRPVDGDGDGIADCDIGAFEALDCGADSDGDGTGDACDCAPADPGAIRIPAEADLRVASDPASGAAVVTWQDLGADAGTSTVYDVASDSIGALWTGSVADAPCVATGVVGPWVDARPVTDLGWYYLVRGVNACGPPAGQGWGRDSRGAARPACP